MTETEISSEQNTEPAGYLNTALNVFAAPSEAFNELRQRPAKLFPLVLLLVAQTTILFWYFNIIDYAWYVDDTLSIANVDESDMDEAREAMNSLSQTTFMWMGIVSGTLSLLLIWVLQAGYLGLASALNGDKYKFTHWFSLILWTNLPMLLSMAGMVVNLLLNSTGQLSSFELDPLSLANLGMQSDSGSMSIVMNVITLPMIWGISLTVMAYKQWLDSSLLKALAIVLAPYLLIMVVWAYFALT